jgi:hypothetical protein
MLSIKADSKPTQRVALEPAGRSSVNIKVARCVPASNFVSTGASSELDEATRTVAGPRFSSAAAWNVTTLVAFTMSRLTTNKELELYMAQITSYALDSHKSAELLLLEVRANGEVIMSRTYVRRKTIVIKGLLGRHSGRNRNGWVVKK